MITNNLAEELYDLDSSCLYGSLYGLRAVLSKFLRVDDLPFVFTNRTGKTEAKARSYALLTAMQISKDLQNLKTLRMGGIPVRNAAEITGATVATAYTFPFKLAVELHHVDTNLANITQFVEKMLIAGALELFNFRLQWGPLDWICRVEFSDDSISIPRAEIDDTADPGGIDISVNLTLHTRIGFYRDVARAAAGMPTFAIELGTIPKPVSQRPPKFADEKSP